MSTNPTSSEDRNSDELTEATSTEAEAPAPKELDDLHTEHGDTLIAEQVVAKLAGMAAREVDGVAALGNAARRALDSIAGRIQGGQTSVTGGVAVTKGEREAAVEISVITDYGFPIVEITQKMREKIIFAVEHGTGLKVIEVNINVTDIRLPGDEDEQKEPARAPRQDLR